MRYLKSSLAIGYCLSVIVLTGCASVGKNPAAVERVANHAAYDIAVKLLEKQPQRREQIIQARDSLRVLQTAPSIDALAIFDVLHALPVEELQTSDAQIAMDGGELLIAFFGDPAINPKSEPALRAAVKGLADGFDRRLARPDPPVALARPTGSVLLTNTNLPPVPQLTRAIPPLIPRSPIPKKTRAAVAIPFTTQTATKGTQVPYTNDWHRQIPPPGEDQWGNWNETADYYRQTFPGGTFDPAARYLVRRWGKVDTDSDGKPVYDYIEYALTGAQIVPKDPEGRPLDLQSKATPADIIYLRAFYEPASAPTP